MSLSVSGSNANNPFASLQSLWQQASSASGAQSPSDPLSALLSELNQAGAGGAGLSSNSAAGTAAQPTTPQFGPQTLQALLALQSNGTSAQALAAQFDGGANGDPLSAVASQPSQSPHGHHHHHHGAGGSNGSAGATSDGPTANSGGGSATGNDLQQLLQMQAQLVAPAGTQNTVTT
jgi:hypothetical protein